MQKSEELLEDREEPGQLLGLKRALHNNPNNCLFLFFLFIVVAICVTSVKISFKKLLPHCIPNDFTNYIYANSHSPTPKNKNYNKKQVSDSLKLCCHTQHTSIL